MRSDLGRLGAIAKILQIGPFPGLIPNGVALGLARRFDRFSDKIVPKQRDKRRA
jgi:hypothetical protein